MKPDDFKVMPANENSKGLSKNYPAKKEELPAIALEGIDPKGFQRQLDMGDFYVGTGLVFWIKKLKVLGSDTISEKSKVSNHPKIFIRDMANKGFDEINDLHDFGLVSFGVMVEEFEGDRVAVIGKYSSLG